jgi:hypothetical protein
MDLTTQSCIEECKDSGCVLYRYFRNTFFNFFFNLHSGGVESRFTRHCGHLMAYFVPAPGDYDNGEIGGMIGKGNQSTRKKPAPVPFCPAQTPHAARTRTRAAAVGSQRLTAELRHGL